MPQDVQRGESIRSFHRVFEKDRRLHSIPSGDRPIVLPFEDGVAVRAFSYAVALAGGAFMLLHLPLIGDIMGLAPRVVWYAVVPVLFGVAGSRVERDGLALHRWLELEARHRFTPRVRHGGRAVRPEGRIMSLRGKLPIGRDHHGPSLRGARIAGPGRVEFSEPVGVLERRRGPAVIRPVAALTPRQRKRAICAAAVDLNAGDMLEVRP
jgi:hypothetical protein